MLLEALGQGGEAILLATVRLVGVKALSDVVEAAPHNQTTGSNNKSIPLWGQYGRSGITCLDSIFIKKVHLIHLIRPLVDPTVFLAWRVLKVLTRLVQHWKWMNPTN